MRLEETAARATSGRALVPVAAIGRGRKALPLPPAAPYTALKKEGRPLATDSPASPLTLVFAQLLGAVAAKPQDTPPPSAAARYAAALNLARKDLCALRLCA
jgi:hypothetical protein